MPSNKKSRSTRSPQQCRKCERCLDTFDVSAFLEGGYVCQQCRSPKRQSKKSKSSLRICLMDTETSPNLSYVWARYEQNVIDVHTDWYFLCFAYQFIGDKKVTVKSLPDYDRWKIDTEDDYDLCVDLWKLFDEADIIICHNAAFDVKKAYAKFVTHKLGVPSPCRIICTLKMARQFFKFDSNKLDDLGKMLGVGRKTKHTGKHLWFDCMKGMKSAWRLMTRYNAQDVSLLRLVYDRLKPFATNHPNLNMYIDDGRPACPTCLSPRIHKRGFAYTSKLIYQQYRCVDCGAWHRGERIKK
jgi:hypothetical protein